MVCYKHGSRFEFQLQGHQEGHPATIGHMPNETDPEPYSRSSARAIPDQDLRENVISPWGVCQCLAMQTDRDWPRKRSITHENKKQFFR